MGRPSPDAAPAALYREVDAVAETDYSGWYDHPDDTPAQQSRGNALAPGGDAADVRRQGARDQRVRRRIQQPEPPRQSRQLLASRRSLLARHIAVYAADPQLSGMLVWLLRDYPLIPTFEGGSIHAKLPHVRLIEGLNQKGLFTYAGQPKPAADVVARLYRALPGGVGRCR